LANQLKGDRGDSHENQSNQYRDCRRPERSSYSRQPIKRSAPAHGTPGSIAECAGSHPIVPSPRVTTTNIKATGTPYLLIDEAIRNPTQGQLPGRRLGLRLPSPTLTRKMTAAEMSLSAPLSCSGDHAPHEFAYSSSRTMHCRLRPFAQKCQMMSIAPSTM
jgi:hypothetical protein